MNIIFASTENQKHLVRGFTLVETLVSTMIITLVILGPLTVASNASIYARITKDSLVATYLAQEAIELLHHQQDSVYIRCIQSSTSSCPVVNNESPQQAAWRIFRDRLKSNAQGASCYSDDNAFGCSYDFIDMTTNEDFSPTKYATNEASCNSLSIEQATSLYVCTGVRGSGAGYTTTTFSRSVSIVSLPTFTGADQDYNDDLRVTVTVTFKRPNGYSYQIKVVDFLHARA